MTVKLAALTFLHPVTYAVAGDNGEPIEIKFRARFRRLSKTARELLDKRMRRTWLASQLRATTSPDVRAVLEQHLTELGDAIQPINDAELAGLVLAGWELVDLDGASVPFDDATVAAVYEEWEGIDSAIARTYIEATNPKAAEKNSGKPSPTTSGPTAPTTA